jgi:HK97 family phage prohead protease
MPYFITDKSPDCAGWATIKDDGEVIGCHENKQDAVDHMVAVSLAEDMQPGGERIESGPLAVIVDIDGTLISGGRLIQKTYDYIDDMQDTEIFIVTGRNDSTRADTVAELDSLSVDYDRLFMNPGSTADTVAFKKATAESLLREYNVILAIDNNADNRAAYRELGITALDVTDVPATPQANRAPAPAKDQIQGSDMNKEGSASGAGGDVEFTQAVETGLRNKVTEHNDKMAEDNKPPYTRTTLGQLKAVYRRGSGAYSTSHRPGISRAAWSMARVNAFLYLLRNGRPENPAYIGDNDLLPQGHPRSTRSLDERAINQDAPAYMRAAARRGLAYYAEGKGGDGLVEKTIRDARLMADGQVSDDKWIAIAAWIARHLVDLDSPDADPNSENYPSAGVVAHLLWGSGPTKRQAQRVLDYAQSVVERIRADERSMNDLQNEKWRSIALNLNKDEGQPMTTIVERRVNSVEFDVRAAEASSDGMSFTGYAAVFNSPSEPLPFTEVIKEGAFKRSLKSRNEIKLFMNHNTDVVLGSTRAGTLRLSEDSRGLLAQADLPDTTAGRDLSVLMQRGDVNSMSFGFSVPAKGDTWSQDGATRELHQVRLHEVSIVTGFPAYEATTASVRSLDILAQRTAVDVDALNDAILKLEAGETLDDAHADLISEVVSKLRADKPVDFNALEIKRKQLDLMAKAF